MFGLGPTELVVILVVALIVFGPKRLPEMGKSVGRALNEFKRATQDVEKEIRKEMTEVEKIAKPDLSAFDPPKTDR